jgi:hypothetical protein
MIPQKMPVETRPDDRGMLIYATVNGKMLNVSSGEIWNENDDST